MGRLNLLWSHRLFPKTFASNRIIHYDRSGNNSIFFEPNQSDIRIILLEQDSRNRQSERVNFTIPVLVIFNQEE